MRWSAFSLLFGALFFLGCGQPSTQSSLIIIRQERYDPEAAPVDFPSPLGATAKRRIISLVPSSTEVLFALGFGDRIVGVDRWADFPKEVESLPRLGDISRVGTERILDLSPDLVLLFECQKDSADLLMSAGIDVFIPETEGSMLGSIESVARRAGAPERGEALVKRLRAQVETQRIANEGLTPVRVLMVFERIPRISVATSHGFYEEMLSVVRGVNVSANAHDVKAFTWCSVEQILDWDPEVVIDLTYDQDGSRRTEAEEFWRRLLKGRSRVHLIDAPVLARPGPRLPAALDFLKALIHGG
jgi:iron complex transport system substrate-binding protein